MKITTFLVIINMTMEKRLEAIVRELFMGGDKETLIDSDENFVDSGICDSLGLVKLAMALESEFPGIQIFDQEINRDTIGSLDALNDFIQSKLEDI